MANELAGQISASLAAQGRGTEQATMSARNAFLERTQPQEEQAGMSALDMVSAVQEATKDKSYNEAQDIRGKMWRAIEATDEYQGMAYVDREQFRNNYMTQLTEKGRNSIEALDPADPNNEHILDMYGRYQSMRNGEDVELSGWESFGKSFLRISTTGGIGLGIADFANQDVDVKESLLGTAATEMENIMVGTAARFTPAEAADYKRGKVWGTIAGIGVDMAATVALGNVTGITAKGVQLGRSAQLAIMNGSKAGSVMAKAGSNIARFMIPNSMEATVFIGEEWVNRWVNNELDTNEEIQQFVKDIPGTFGKGLAFAMVGEAMFGAVGSLSKKAKKGAIDALEKSGKSLPPSKASKAVGNLIVEEAGVPVTSTEFKRVSREVAIDFNAKEGWTAETFGKRVQKYKDLGIDEEAATSIVTRQQQAAFLKDPDTWLDDERLNQEGIKNIWGADFEIMDSGDYKFTRFLDSPLEQPAIVSPNQQSLNEFFQTNYEVQWNKFLNEARLSAGFSTQDVQIKVEKMGGISREVKMNSKSVLETFRPADKVVNTQKTQALVDLIAPNAKLKVEVVEGPQYFRNFQRKAGVVVVPKTVTSSAQARDYSQYFFDQISEGTVRSGADVNFDIDQLKALVNTTTDLRYNKAFFKKMNTRIDVTRTPEGFAAKVGNDPVLVDGKPHLFSTEQDAIDFAAKEFHIQKLGGLQGIQEHLAWKGVTLELKGSQLHTKVNGDDYKVFKNLEDMLDDPFMRPGIPYADRPSTFDVAVYGDGKSHKTFGYDGDDRVIGVRGASETLREVSQNMKGYEKVGRGAYKIKDTGIEGVDVYTNGALTTVSMPSTGYFKEFVSVNSAKNYLENLDKRYHNIVGRAAESGMVVRPTASGWAVGNDWKIEHFKNIQDVENYLGRDSVIKVRDVADVWTASDATKISESAVDGAIGKRKIYNQQKIDKANQRAKRFTTSRTKNAMDRFTKQTGARIRTNGNVGSIKMFNLLENSYRALDGHTRTAQNKIREVFSGYSEDQLHFMGMLLQRQGPRAEWGKSVKEINKALGTSYELTPKMVKTLGDAGELFRQGGLQFGVDGYKWVNDYAPMMADKKWLEAFDIRDKSNPNIGNDKLRQLLAHNKIPAQDVPFFMHTRADEAGGYLMTTNLRDMLTGYYNIGLRTQYMEDPINQLTKFAKQLPNDDLLKQDMNLMKQMLDSINGRVVDTPTAQKIHALNEIKRARKNEVFGVNMSDPGQAKKTMDEIFGSAIENSGQDFESLVKRLESTDAMKSPDKFWSNMINSALMAWNMRMPIRNVGQIFTNLSPINGLKYTTRGLRDIVGNKDVRERLYREALDKGIIMPDGKFKAMHNATEFLDNNLNAGMYIFRRSDDLTRLVAMRSSELRVGDALSKAKMEIGNGTFNADVFMRDTAADYLDPDIQNRVLDMLAGRDNAGAIMNEKGITSLIQREVSLMTMYDYTPHVRPEAFRTQYGQVLGKMGTWPVAYLDLMKRGLSARGTEFAVKVLAAQAAMGVLYNDVLDMNGVAYTPLGNMAFTGGPGLEGIPNAINGITSATAGLFTGTQTPKQAATGLMKSTSWFMPFYKQGKGLGQSVEAIQNDEYREGILTFLGANPDWNSPGISGLLGINMEPNEDYSFEFADWWEGIAQNFNFGANAE